MRLETGTVGPGHGGHSKRPVKAEGDYAGLLDNSLPASVAAGTGYELGLLSHSSRCVDRHHHQL